MIMDERFQPHPAFVRQLPAERMDIVEPLLLLVAPKAVGTARGCRNASWDQYSQPISEPLL